MAHTVRDETALVRNRYGDNEGCKPKPPIFPAVVTGTLCGAFSGSLIKVRRS